MSGITTSLNATIQQNHTNVEEEPNLITPSPYYTNEKFINTMKQKDNVFKCLCLNIQSLNAKIDQLRVFVNSLEQHDVKIDAILLQETWLGKAHDESLLQIEGYNLITQPYEITTHGGLAIYLLQDINYDILEYNKSQSGIWEGLFLKVKVSSHKSITIGNIYRPPRDLMIII
jgi:hypothetical protein